jgi:hypothetical protein
MALAMMLAVPIAANAAEAMRVVRDPQTGELRGPTAAEAAAFQKAEAQLRAARSGKAAQRASAPQEITYPDGTVEMPLDEDSMMSSVATLAPDGSVRMHCLPSQQARALVKGSKKAPVAKVVAP